MKHLKRFDESNDWEESDESFLVPGEYILYGFIDLPLPIEITSIEGDMVQFQSDWNEVNRDYWHSDFIGTDMEGLGYDPHSSDFRIGDIEKLEGDKIYLKDKSKTRIGHYTVK